MKKETCFALSKSGRCMILTKGDCENCSFKKSPLKYVSDRLRYNKSEEEYEEKTGSYGIRNDLFPALYVAVKDELMKENAI